MTTKVYIPETLPEIEIKDWDIPWLTKDKIDAKIWIRWAVDTKFYSTYTTHSGTSDKTITCWFRPKLVYIYTILPWDRDSTLSWSIEKDWAIYVVWAFKDWQYRQEIPYWDNFAVYLNSWSTSYEMTEFTNTWFTLGNITDTSWNTFWLQITVLW